MKQAKTITIISIFAIAVLAFAASKIVNNKAAPPQNTKVIPSQNDNTSSTGIIQDQALLKVKNLPEVKDYQAMLFKAGTRATFEIEDQNEVWAVHVFEIVENGADVHTATFGWYSVNKNTGVISKDL